MKLTENDYSAPNRTLQKVDGTFFPKAETIIIKDKNGFKSLSADLLSTEILYRLSFPAEFAGFEQDGFDECFLAELRDFLKLLEPEEKTVIISVTCSTDIIKNKELTLELFYHIARRIKDCASVAGFVLPECQPQENDSCFIQKIIETLQKKHPEYVYFLKNENHLAELSALYPARIALL